MKAKTTSTERWGHSLAWRAVLVVALLFPAVSAFSQGAAPGKWAFSANEMSVPRYSATATLLAGGKCDGAAPPNYCGKVLVVGGNSSSQYLASAELFDPKSGLWIRCTRGQSGSDCPKDLEKARGYHSATLIQGTPTQCGSRCGNVLVAGGIGEGATDLSYSAEILDPDTGEWSDANIPSTMNGTAILGLGSDTHTATQLATGEILFVGRQLDLPVPSRPGLIYNPRENAWSETASANVIPRGSHVAVRLDKGNCGLNCGKVLIAGANNQSADYSANRTAELYDPNTGFFTPTGSALYPIRSSDAALLPDGRVLVAGFYDAAFDPDLRKRSQVYDPSTGQWTATEVMAEQRQGRFLTPISGGRILAAGGHPSSTVAEIFYPNEVGPTGARGNWRLAPDSLNQPRNNPAPVDLGCDKDSGQALAIGGQGNSTVWSSSEIYNRTVRVSTVTPTSGRLAGGTLITIRGMGLEPPPGRTASVMVGDRVAGIVASSNTEIRATAPPGGAPGDAEVTVSVDGATAECSPELTFTYLPVPQLTAITPPQGPAIGGTRVTLSGSGFAAGSSVRFGSQPAGSVEVSTDGTRIIADAPPNNPGALPVVVTTPAGDVVESAFKYLPTITGVVPDNGPPEGGTTVTIAGKGFTGVRTVTFDGIEVAPTDVADGVITVKSPPHPPGQVRVGVDVPPHGPAIPVAAGADTFTYGAEAVPLGGGSGQTSIGSTSVAPGSQTPTTSGGGPSAAGGSAPPPPAQGQAVPLFSQSPVSVFEPGSSAMQSGSASSVQSPGGVQAPGAAGSQAHGPQPALVSVPEIRPDRAEQYAMVGLSGKAVDPAGFGLAAALVGLLLCGGLALGGRETTLEPQARPQEAY